MGSNRNLRQLAFQVEAARGLLIASGASLSPQFSVGGGATRSRANASKNPPTQALFQAALGGKSTCGDV